MAKDPPRYNRLVNELSPYLRKHAENPVDWHPWGDEAFELARREDKPVFLSIGYTTCHWCNVMEEESFSDPEAAALLNETFINIKVDREERPDVDAVYMAACQILNKGRGGWPLSIFLDHERRPFFAGTYFPKASREGQIGLMDIVPRIKYIWLNDRESLTRSSAEITEAIGRTPEAAGGHIPTGTELAYAAYVELEESYDSLHGGFGTAPKFPTPHMLMLLLRRQGKTGEKRAFDMAAHTLRAMRRGGMYDQLGGGFHRYSTDRQWLVPHFEKMLYDQSLLMMALAEAFLATGEGEFKRVAGEVAACLLRDFASPEGVFYSAWGADSTDDQGKFREGAFYLWTVADIREALGKGADGFMASFNIKPDGNFTDPFGEALEGENILHLSPEAMLPDEKLQKAIAGLYKERQHRALPELDDKVLADWNGLAIAAFAKCGRAFGEPSYIDVAKRAAEFLLGEMSPGGRLMHRWHSGHTMVDANADDYAFLIWGLIELHQATLDARWLSEAGRLTSELMEGFHDPEGGGFWFTHEGAKGLPVRRKEIYDGATPSGNSVMLMNLARLWRLLGDSGLEDTARGVLGAFGSRAAGAPSAYSMLAIGAELLEGPITEVTIEGRPPDLDGGDDTRAMIDALAGRFLPNVVVRFSQKDQPAVAHVCTGSECLPPVGSAGEMMAALGL